jgi:RNA polymerase sigma-70 factor (ECF subfamily)
LPPESETPRQVADVEKWITEARAGSREALGQLLEVCRRYLLLVANEEQDPSLQAKVSPSDLVQETLLEAGRDFPRFQGASEPELLAWLRCILRNNLANAQRHFEAQKRQVSREVPLAEAPLDQLRDRTLDQGDSPSAQALARERDEQLERALQQLPDQYRQVLQWHSRDKLTFVQIAEKMGRTADAVRKLWGRAIEELAGLLETPHEST